MDYSLSDDSSLFYDNDALYEAALDEEEDEALKTGQLYCSLR